MPINWITRVWHEYRADNLTRAYRDVLLTLRSFRGAGGLIYPSHATLADRARCSVRTVQRALQQAQHLGLVSWTERRVRAAWRWLRTSNTYRLVVPANVIRAGLRAAVQRRVTTGQNDHREEKTTKKGDLEGMLLAAAALPDLLARRREMFSGRKLMT